MKFLRSRGGRVGLLADFYGSMVTPQREGGGGGGGGGWEERKRHVEIHSNHAPFILIIGPACLPTFL